MRAFVTGATGFLGSRVVAQLLADGWRVRASSRSADQLTALMARTDPEACHRVDPVYLRLDRDPLVSSLFRDCDVLFHVAGALRGAPSSLFLHNVVVTRRLLTAARDSDLRRIVVVSSLAVYASAALRAGSEVNEFCPLEPRPELRGAYVMSKVAQEQVCWTSRHEEGGLPFVVVRPGVIYGPGRSPLSDRVGLKVGRHLFVIGGRRRLPYTYVDNCARAVVLAGGTPGIDGLAFNVVDDDLPTGALLARRAATGLRRWPMPARAIVPLALGYDLLRRYSAGQLPAALGPYLARSVYKPLRYANVRAKQALGWQPHVGLDEALRRTLSGTDR